MPISDDEYESSRSSHHIHYHHENTHHIHHQHQHVIQQPIVHHGMTKAEIRKSNKPIMEKKRRARINNCLNELKSLILDAMKKDPARHSKLEKADILEMTVKHLQTVQRQQLAIAVATDPAVLHKFKNGFGECVTEVNRYINRIDGVDTGVRQRLSSHLSQCLNSLQQLNPYTSLINSPSTSSSPIRLNEPIIPTPITIIQPTVINTNNSSGDVNNNNNGRNFIAPSVSSVIMNRSHPSAFTAVSNKPYSPSSSTTNCSSSGDECYDQQQQQVKVTVTSSVLPTQSALDFSMNNRKRSYHEEVLNNNNNNNKIPRFSLHLSTDNNKVFNLPPPPQQIHPPTATPGPANNDSMWRPW